jgi:hypothetical protein
MKKCPACNRTYDDETFNFCLEDGAALLSQNDEIETVISNKSYNLPTLLIIDEPIVAINIARQYPLAKNAEDLYNFTRGLWRLNKQRAEKAKYAFAVYKRLIKEVYKIHRWVSWDAHSSEFWVRELESQGTEIDPKTHEGRYQFIGELAPDIIRNKYIGREIPMPHAQNPIRYFNC